MNICFLSKEYPPNIIGGVGTYTWEMAHALAKLGHNVYVVTEATNETSEYVEDGIRVFGVKPARFPLNGAARALIKGTLERLEYSYAVSKRLRMIVNRYNIDVVESCEARAEGFWYYIFKRKPPLVIRLHTPEGIIAKWNHAPDTLDYKLTGKLEEFWIFKANKTTAISKAMINLMSRHYKFRFNNIAITPNPVDLNLFKGAPVFEKNRDSIVLYAGRLEFRKGVHILIKAIPKVLKKIPEAKFIFIGNDCGMKGYLLNKIDEFGCRKNVIFVEQACRESLVEYYQKSSLCIVPSLWENAPYSCLEAMACARPVIASDAGGLSEIIEDSINGILIPPGSSLALAETIVKVLNDRRLQERLGNNARKYIEKKYAPSEVVQRTLEIYNTLLD
jgi:glycosyltransferase involved in cell wall biosynthesis